MTGFAIRAEGIGKQYALGEQAPYRRLTEVLSSRLFRPWRSGVPATAPKNFWALKDISFEIGHGEVVGLIGRNGAGKSTLLKLLSRITEPSEGDIWLNGRVGSLLEVGTGFHPELTGRENIFLNGAILGMKRQEIMGRFDEIVAFSEIETFLDTPVKHYSSGMYMRLAFSVAAHMEADILLIDEVLAVGDAEFQKKCLGKMNQVARQGRTVLFVSHNMAAVEHLCHRCLLFETGRLAFSGAPHEVISRYLLTSGQGQVSLAQRTDRKGDGSLRGLSIELYDEHRQPIHSVYPGQAFQVRVGYTAATAKSSFLIALDMETHLGSRLASLNNLFSGHTLSCTAGAGEAWCHIDGLNLRPDTYHFNLWIGEASGTYDLVERAVSIEVLSRDIYGTGRLPESGHGPLLLKYRWS